MTPLPHNWTNWRPDPRVQILTEGTRGSGELRGDVGVADHPAGVYPSCSRHGAMNRLGERIWRCLAEGCNAGAEIDPPWDSERLPWTEADLTSEEDADRGVHSAEGARSLRRLSPGCPHSPPPGDVDEWICEFCGGRVVSLEAVEEGSLR